MKQNYDKNIIEWLFHQFFPEKEIFTYEVCDGGVENSNFLLITSDGKYVLKVFESSRHDEKIIRSEVEIMVEVRNMGSCVPEIFLTQEGQSIIIWPEWKLVILMEFIQGEKYHDILPDSELYCLLGKRVAEFQNNLADISEKYFAPERHIFDIAYLFTHSELHMCVPEYSKASFLHSVWADLNEIKDTFLKLPHQIIHNDINSANVIFRDHEPYFIDFSDMVRGTCIQDIAIALTQKCFHHKWNPEWTSHFLAWFQTIRQLTDEEKICLFWCIEARMLNILMIPYLDIGVGDYGEIQDYIRAYHDSLNKFHEFWKENFMKLIF